MEEESAESYPKSGAYLSTVEGIVIGITVAAIRRGIGEAGERKEQQAKFWDGILSKEERELHRVVCGADQARGGPPHPHAYRALHNMIGPTLLQQIDAYLKGVKNPLTFFELEGAAATIDTLGELIKKLAIRGIQFVRSVRCRASRLALPIGGHISNSFVELQLRKTQNVRRFRVVAVKPGHAEPRELTTKKEITTLRTEKRRLLKNRGDTDESIVLDAAINYELWSNKGAEAQPHRESKAGDATDSIYVLFTRPPTGNGEAVLSVQSLHPLGLAAMSLFHFPRKTLGKDAEVFRSAALHAMQTRNSIGFEAILKVKRKQEWRPNTPETPRNFSGSPTLSTVEVSVQKAPQPLIQK